MRWLVTEIKTVKLEARDKRAAMEKAVSILEHYAPDTHDIHIEELTASTPGELTPVNKA